MRENIKITERDIFDYVFNNEELSPNKIKEINNNLYYQDKIEFYKKLKENLNSVLNKDIKVKIASKIPPYKSSKPSINFRSNKLQIK